VTGRETGTVLVVADDRDETASRVCTVRRDLRTHDDAFAVFNI
jgi:hypothetical protein